MKLQVAPHEPTQWPDDVIPVHVNMMSVAVVSSSEMTRWMAAFSPASREDVIPVRVNMMSVTVVSSSEMTRWIAAFSPASREDDDEKLYSERNG